MYFLRCYITVAFNVKPTQCYLNCYQHTPDFHSFVSAICRKFVSCKTRCISYGHITAFICCTYLLDLISCTIAVALALCSVFCTAHQQDTRKPRLVKRYEDTPDLQWGILTNNTLVLTNTCTTDAEEINK